VAKFVDNYFDNLEQIQKQLLEKVSKILPRLEQLNTEQKLQAIRALNFMDEMKTLGLSNAIDTLYNDFNKEITSALLTATNLGASVSTVNLQAIETMRLLEVDSLVKGFEQYASDLKKELMRAVITGEPAQDLANRLKAEYGAEKMLTGKQKRVVVGDAFARLSNATTAEAFANLPQQKFTYVGPQDQVTRDICKEVLRSAKNDTGYTAEEINALGSVDFATRGGWNCRHDWIPV
jgi:hypothetical protein